MSVDGSYKPTIAKPLSRDEVGNFHVTRGTLIDTIEKKWSEV